MKRFKSFSRRFIYQSQIENRAEDIGLYVVNTGSTVRVAAAKFNVSKTTVHKDLSERLEKINPVLWREVKQVLEHNKEERHIRGGMTTKLRYKK